MAPSDDDTIWFDEYGEPFEPTEPSDVAVKRDLDTARRIDLGPFLDGSYVPPKPTVGGQRDAGAAHMLYPTRWHTLIAPTASGKSWWALWHIISELRSGHTVAYAHFEEFSPGGTIERLRSAAPDLDDDMIKERFIWLDCSYRWNREAWQLALPTELSLVVLDGINACCGQHGWLVDKTEAVGEYRSLFVTPAIKRGAAVISLGHPPKSPDRQNERHGFGSSAWLDEVDGVGFRLKLAKSNPIRRGQHGWASCYVVKDRYGQVEALGRVESSGDSEGWYYVGALHIDATIERDNIVIFMSSPAPESTPGPAVSKLDKLADEIMAVITHLPDRRFSSLKNLKDRARAADVKFREEDFAPALMKLETRGWLDWPEVPGVRMSRPGQVSQTGFDAWAAQRGLFEPPPAEDDVTAVLPERGSPEPEPPAPLFPS